MPLAVSPITGTKLLQFIKNDVPIVPEDQRNIPLAFTMVGIRYQDNYIFVHNRTRRTWEIPGGGIEQGETPHECAIREVWEESNQHIESPQYQGLIKLQLGHNNKVEFGAIFTAELTELSPFSVNNEMDGFMLWDLEQDIGAVSPISKTAFDLAWGF